MNGQSSVPSPSANGALPKAKPRNSLPSAANGDDWPGDHVLLPEEAQARTAKEEAEQAKGKSEQAKDETNQASKPILLSLADVHPQPVKWLWPGRIALGKLTLLAGDPGLGKSFVTLDIAARVSRGTPWPDSLPGKNPAGGVVLLSAEDDPEDTIRPRLDAAGADVQRIKALKAVLHNSPKAGAPPIECPFSLVGDLPALEEAIRAVQGCRLVIIDPITAYLGQTDSHKNAEMRGLLAPLAALAAEYAIAIVCVTHLNKNGSGPAIYRSMGSLAFAAAARAVWGVVKDKENPRRRLFLPVKNNLAEDILGLAYTIEPYGPNGAPVVAWESDCVAITADEAMQSDNGNGEKEDGDQAQAWLRDALKDGPMPAAVVLDQGKANGFTNKAVRKAFLALGGQRKKAEFKGGWSWWLPSHEDAQHPSGASSASWESSQKTKESSAVSSLEDAEDAEDSQDFRSEHGQEPSHGGGDEWGIVP